MFQSQKELKAAIKRECEKRYKEVWGKDWDQTHQDRLARWSLLLSAANAEALDILRDLTADLDSAGKFFAKHEETLRRGAIYAAMRAVPHLDDVFKGSSETNAESETTCPSCLRLKEIVSDIAPLLNPGQDKKAELIISYGLDLLLLRSRLEELQYILQKLPLQRSNRGPEYDSPTQIIDSYAEAEIRSADGKTRKPTVEELAVIAILADLCPRRTGDDPEGTWPERLKELSAEEATNEAIKLAIPTVRSSQARDKKREAILDGKEAFLEAVATPALARSDTDSQPR